MTDAPTADSGPGFLAFVAFFLLAIALWFLMRNMNARMRRMSYRQQAGAPGPATSPQADDGDGPVDGGAPTTDEADGRIPGATAAATSRQRDEGGTERRGDEPR